MYSYLAASTVAPVITQRLLPCPPGDALPEAGKTTQSCDLGCDPDWEAAPMGVFTWKEI